MKKILNIVVPMAGAGKRFHQLGYTFPKPLIEIDGKPMIQVVVENLKPKIPHKFIFICKKEHYNQYSLHEIFSNLTGNNFECVQLSALTEGAACTVLTAAEYINNGMDLLIANSDQVIDIHINKFVKFSRDSLADGVIMTFPASHPKWSYAKVDKKGNVIETAEKRVISNRATVGIYYFREGRQFVEGASEMIEKDIRVNNEFYVCPVYNEMILKGGIVKTWDIKPEQMHGLGIPEDLTAYLDFIKKK